MFNIYFYYLYSFILIYIYIDGMSNYINLKAWNEITFLFPNLQGVVEVSNFILHFTGYVITSISDWSMYHVEKRMIQAYVISCCISRLCAISPQCETIFMTPQEVYYLQIVNLCI